jgi:hypothetical protein
VNGDDMLYCAPKELFNRHIDIGRKVGLEMTVGKAYHHRSYTNVNSTCVDCPIGTNRVTQINFLNTGLFFGQQKVMGTAEVECPEMIVRKSNIVPLLNDVLSGSLPGKQIALLKAWFKVHSFAEISRDTRVSFPKGDYYRNLFLPLSMGGMGVVPPVGWRFFTSRQDRKYAEMLWDVKVLQNMSDEWPLRCPQPREIESMKSVPWLNFSIEKDEVRAIGYKKCKEGKLIQVKSYFSTNRVRTAAQFIARNSGVLVRA